MIVSVLEFSLRPGAVKDLEQVFREYRILETAMGVEGCWKLALVSPQDRTDSASVIGMWADHASYQRWMDHPDRGVASAALLPLMAGDFDTSAPAVLYDVRHATPNESAWADVSAHDNREEAQ